ncbi:MAG: ABC transporter substrate-binding protein [Polaromonas sp.]
MKHLPLLSLALVVLGLVNSPASAQQPGDILIGVSLPLSGSNAAAGEEGMAVMKAYFDSVNKAGGIEGRMLQLTVLDDGFIPTKAAENAQTLIEAKALALFNCWGTSSCNAMMPAVSKAGAPLVGGIAGGGLMRQQPDRTVFNVRASTEAEIAMMVKQMATVGQTSIAVVYQNDPFGKSGQTAAQAVFARLKLKPVTEMAIEPDASNAAAVTDALKKLPALNGIILVASPPATIGVITQARKSGLNTQFYNLAAQANPKVVAGLGEFTAGVVFTTLVPNPWKDDIAVVREYQKIHSMATGKHDYSYLGLEVFINARTLVEGLRKGGRNVSRESLVAALESMGEKVYGPMTVRFKPGSHEGSSYVGLAIINRQGRFVE